MRKRLFKEEELSGGGEGLFKEKVRRGLKGERKGREGKEEEVGGGGVRRRILKPCSS